jgi:hypothetical protein
MQPKTVCPKCRQVIPLDDINVATDIALCRNCAETWKFSDLIDEDEIDFRPTNSPPGTWYREIPPRAFEVGVSTRSGVAFFLVPFMCVWSGFSLGGIYGTQIVKKHFDLSSSLFGIPFLLGTVLFGSFALMSVCGKIVVRVDGEQGVVFYGVGPFGWKRRFNWRNVTAIRRTQKYGGENGPYQVITLEGEKKLNFGTGIKSERLDFMLAALRKKWRETSHS